MKIQDLFYCFLFCIVILIQMFLQISDGADRKATMWTLVDRPPLMIHFVTSQESRGWGHIIAFQAGVIVRYHGCVFDRTCFFFNIKFHRLWCFRINLNDETNIPRLSINTSIKWTKGYRLYNSRVPIGMIAFQMSIQMLRTADRITAKMTSKSGFLLVKSFMA